MSVDIWRGRKFVSIAVVFLGVSVKVAATKLEKVHSSFKSDKKVSMLFFSFVILKISVWIYFHFYLTENFQIFFISFQEIFSKCFSIFFFLHPPQLFFNTRIVFAFLVAGFSSCLYFFHTKILHLFVLFFFRLAGQSSPEMSRKTFCWTISGNFTLLLYNCAVWIWFEFQGQIWKLSGFLLQFWLWSIQKSWSCATFNFIMTLNFHKTIN